MNRSLALPKFENLDFSAKIKSIAERLQDPSAEVTVEGFTGASRALFLSHLKKNLRRPMVVLTADQNTGEALLGDLKYFFHHEISPDF